MRNFRNPLPAPSSAEQGPSARFDFAALDMRAGGPRVPAAQCMHTKQGGPTGAGRGGAWRGGAGREERERGYLGMVFRHTVLYVTSG